MARTQAADYDRRREAILERAAGLFAKRGFAETSVADLALACNASKSLIYHYYASKEDILYAVMTSHIDELVEDISNVLTSAADTQTQLRRLVHHFMERYVHAADRQKVLLNELDSLPTKRRAAIVGKQRSIIDAVSGLLAALGGRLAHNPPRLRVQAMLLLGMINWTHTWFDPGGPLGVGEVADMALALILPPNPQAS